MNDCGVGATVVTGARVVGGAVVGTVVVGATVVVVGGRVVGGAVVGAAVVGTAVMGTVVVGATVEGAAVGGTVAAGAVTVGWRVVGGVVFTGVAGVVRTGTVATVVAARPEPPSAPRDSATVVVVVRSVGVVGSALDAALGAVVAVVRCLLLVVEGLGESVVSLAFPSVATGADLVVGEPEVVVRSAARADVGVVADVL